MPSRAEPIEENQKKKTRTVSCSNASLPRVNESRWHQQTGAEHVAQQREDPSGQPLENFATLPSAVVKVARAKW